MPTIAELVQKATKFEYNVGGAKVTVERRRSAETKTEKEIDDERNKYFELRDEVWSFLRRKIRERESFQRALKTEAINRVGPLYSKMIGKEILRNAAILTNLYGVVRFTRHGLLCSEAAQIEDFFNVFFHKNVEFRNKYWTYWNRKHNKKGKAERVETKECEKKAECGKTSCSENKKPYHCPNCRQFVSRKTNYCSRCKKKVSEG